MKGCYVILVLVVELVMFLKYFILDSVKLKCIIGSRLVSRCMCVVDSGSIWWQLLSSVSVILMCIVFMLCVSFSYVMVLCLIVVVRLNSVLVGEVRLKFSMVLICLLCYSRLEICQLLCVYSCGLLCRCLVSFVCYGSMLCCSCVFYGMCVRQWVRLGCLCSFVLIVVIGLLVWIRLLCVISRWVLCWGVWQLVVVWCSCVSVCLVLWVCVILVSSDYDIVLWYRLLFMLMLCSLNVYLLCLIVVWLLVVVSICIIGMLVVVRWVMKWCFFFRQVVLCMLW